MPFNSGGSNNFLTIYKGYLAHRLMKVDPNNPPEGAKSRELEKGPNAGKTIWEVHHKSFTGMLSKLPTLEKADFGMTLVLYLSDDQDEYKLSMPVDSGYAIDFMKRYPNMDVSKQHEFAPYSRAGENGRDKNYFLLYPHDGSARGDLVQSIYNKKDETDKIDLPRWVNKGENFDGTVNWDKNDFFNTLFHNMKLKNQQVTPNALDAAAAYGKQKAEQSKDKTDSSTITHVPLDEEQAPPQQATPQQQQGFSSDPQDLPF